MKSRNILSYHIRRSLLWIWLTVVFANIPDGLASCYYIIPLLLALPHLNELRKAFLKWLKDDAEK